MRNHEIVYCIFIQSSGFIKTACRHFKSCSDHVTSLETVATRYSTFHGLIISNSYIATVFGCSHARDSYLPRYMEIRTFVYYLRCS